MLVRPPVRQSVEDVGDRGDAAEQRYLLAGDSVRIATAVEALVVRRRDLLGDVEQRRAAAGKDRAADFDVGLDEPELGLGERPGLEQDPIRDADLADVVQRRPLVDQVRLVLSQLELACDRTSGPAHSLSVLAGLVVAILRGQCQALKDLQPRVVEVLGALEHLLLERVVVAAQSHVQHLHLEQVANSQQDLRAVERRGDEIPGAVSKRSAARLARHVRGQHQHLHPVGYSGRLQLLHHLEPVGLLHVQIEQHQVGGDASAQRHDVGRLRGRDDVVVAGLLEDVLKKREIVWLVVDDQDLRGLRWACLQDRW